MRLNFPKKNTFFLKIFFLLIMEKEFVTQIYCFLKGSVYGKKGENCLKRLILKNVAFIQIQRVAIYDWDRKKSI